MASVLSKSPSLTATTNTTLSNPIDIPKSIHLWPSSSKKVTTTVYNIGDDPQLRFNKFVAEVLQSERSLQLNDELGKGGTRTLAPFGFDQARQAPSIVKRIKIDKMERAADDGWESVQDYGNFLREAADTFRTTEMFSSTPPPPSPPLPSSQTISTSETPDTSPYDWQSWKTFNFTDEFARLAPLSPQESQLQGHQSAKLIDWIKHSINDALFRNWRSLDQIISTPSNSEDARQEREPAASKPILHTPNDDDLLPDLIVREEASNQTPLSRELVQASLAVASTSQLAGREEDRAQSAQIEPRESSGGAEDTRSVVSQDNHWRRTIFG